MAEVLCWTLAVHRNAAMQWHGISNCSLILDFALRNLIQSVEYSRSWMSCFFAVQFQANEAVMAFTTGAFGSEPNGEPVAFSLLIFLHADHRLVVPVCLSHTTGNWYTYLYTNLQNSVLNKEDFSNYEVQILSYNQSRWSSSWLTAGQDCQKSQWT